MPKSKPVRLTCEGEVRLRDLLAQEQSRLEEATQILATLMAEAKDEDETGLEEAAQEKARLEARIADIQNTLERAEIIDEVDTSAGIGLGALVELRNETAGKDMTVRLVSAAEATMRGNDGIARVSEDSPVGRELVGRQAGESFMVTLGNGKQMKYAIQSVGA